MATHSSTLACKIPWTEEPDRLQSKGSLRVGHDWVTSLSCIGEGNGNPLQCSCLENPRDGGAWWAAVYGVAQGLTRLKRLSSSSSSKHKQVSDKLQMQDILKSNQPVLLKKKKKLHYSHGIPNKDGGSFPGGSEIKSPPADAVDTSSICDPQGSHMPWRN